VTGLAKLKLLEMDAFSSQGLFKLVPQELLHRFIPPAQSVESFPATIDPETIETGCS
jgi:hypothetical protein